jgi:membrane protease YdiL (CAAX protease family)
MIMVSPAGSARWWRRLPWTEAALLVFLLLIWPGVSWLLFPIGDRALAALADISRAEIYLQSIAITASVLLLLVVSLRSNRQSYRELGYRKLTITDLLWGIVLLLVANGLLLLIRVMIPAWRPGPDDFVFLLLPRSTTERLLWLGLSITAAIGEETLFRGFLMTRLYRLCGRWTPALGLSAVAFGLAHLYQGWSGVVLTGMYGLIFSLMFVSRGSLWPCIIAHFLQDAVAALPLEFPGP